MFVINMIKASAIWNILEGLASWFASSFWRLKKKYDVNEKKLSKVISKSYSKIFANTFVTNKAV